jgi:alkylation response protein AidB-like acyl-CoA dehydrogenase
VGEGYAIIERAAEVAIAALAAEAVGAMAALHEATLEYLKTRKQFGVPIGKFQVLQHRAVEMYMEIEQARSLSLLAAVKVDSSDPAERARAVHAAKVRVGRAAKFVGQAAIQMHGGMGMTDELDVGHYFKRLTMIEATLGDTDHHLAAFASLDVGPAEQQLQADLKAA